MLIRAAVARTKNAPFVVEDLELDDPGPTEILVKVEAAGICHTDIAIRDGWLPLPLPIVLGHEGAGTVIRVGDRVRKVAPGDRVAMTYASCGHCRLCASGHPAYCESRGALNTAGARPDGTNALHADGGMHGFMFSQSSFATYSIAVESNLVKLSQTDSLTLAGPVGCGIQTGAGTVLNCLRPSAGSSLVVFGVGAVGLAAVMAARLRACAKVIAVDLSEPRLELALQVGATHTLRGDDPDLVEKIRAISRGGADYSVETTAVPAVARRAFDTLAPRGACAVLGLGPAGTELSIDMTMLLRSGRTIMGVTEGDSVPDEFIPYLMQLHARGDFPIDRLVRTYPLNAINAAVEDTERGDVVKAVLLPH